MKHLVIFLLSLVVAMTATAETQYVIGEEHLTSADINAGGIYVAIHTENSLASKYLSNAGSTQNFSSTTGANTFLVEKVSGGIVLKNVLSDEYIGGSGATIARTKDKSSAKVFTVKDITTSVANVTSDSKEAHYFSFQNGNTTYYLNSNCKSADGVMYEGVQYATGNGCWSVWFVYPVTTQEVKERPFTYIIPAPKTVEAGEGSLSDWNMDDITVITDETVPEEGYILDITSEGITVKASTEKGVFYARKTIERLAFHDTVLPALHIEDSPRFGYRGFMLDCSRHFFTVDEIKKMLDLMATYKMNVFHWHLTDDQGWRAEIKQYPKLTTTGAVRSNSWNTDIYMVNDYWWTGVGANTNQQYGPYFYTQEEMKDVVEYAKALHIDVLPEVDMPGHFVAAMASYPEYSCTPANPPTVWTTGGISSNVLNIGNPAAVQFAKNILSELCDIFPYPYIHIGGDECPTTQWESNAKCQALYQSLGLSSYRALQTHFIKDISDFVATKGKKLVCWNESVTASGADTDLMKETGATIMCWNPCQSGAQKAVSLGLDAIITEYHSTGGGYYINRRQSNDYGEPTGAGYGDDTVQGCYEYVPVQGSASEHYRGVQGTFWTEHVSSNEYLEYLALPRLICVAEAGWSPQSLKDWSNFKTRLTEDTRMLDEKGYIYGRHWMDGYIHRTDTKEEVTPETSSLENPKWMKIKFTNGSTFLQMNGEEFATTAAEKTEDCQFFALIPVNASSPSLSNIYLYSADGYWVAAKSGKATNGQTTLLLYGTQSKTSAKKFNVQTCPSDNTKYVISPTSNLTLGMNTWGGSGAGVNIGFYSTSDTNDRLVFMTDNSFVTGIKEIRNSDCNMQSEGGASSAIYDLSGRQMALPKGIVIQNSKKVLVK